MDEKNCTAGYTGAPAPRSALAEEPTPRVVFQHAAASIFVDAAKGSDAAAGSESAPLKTVEAAIAKARKAAGAPSTIVLRAGTYYLKETLALTAADSGLTIESFSGEVAEISGAHPLTALEWKPVNVSAHTKTPVTMSVLPDTNMVEGCATLGSKTATCPLFGLTDTAAACAAACAKDATCVAYTWHTAHQLPGNKLWDKQCYLVPRSVPRSNVHELEHISGVKIAVGETVI